MPDENQYLVRVFRHVRVVSVWFACQEACSDINISYHVPFVGQRLYSPLST